MIRTRDFMLFMLVLVFLCLLISVTVLRDAQIDSHYTTLDFNQSRTPVIVEQEIDDEQEKRLANLKAKLASGDGELLSAPPIFTSVDDPILDGPATTTDDMFIDRVAQYCGTPLPHPAAATWSQNPQLEILNQTVVVSEIIIRETQSGSSTETVAEQRELVSIPLRSIRSLFDTCLSDLSIGVATNGTLLSNQSAQLYQQTPPTTIIGYARDGFIIYGPLEDESELDQCGGRYNNFVYEYHVRKDEPFIIGCYAGQPNNLNP